MYLDSLADGSVAGIGLVHAADIRNGRGTASPTGCLVHRVFERKRSRLLPTDPERHLLVALAAGAAGNVVPAPEKPLELGTLGVDLARAPVVGEDPISLGAARRGHDCLGRAPTPDLVEEARTVDDGEVV